MLRIQDQGATVFQKVLSTIFSLGIVFLNLQTLAFVRVNFESTAFDLSQLPELSDRAQRFVEFVGAEEVTFSLIPNNPILFVWWIAVLVILLEVLGLNQAIKSLVKNKKGGNFLLLFY